MARYIDADLLIETMRERYDEICDTYGYHDLYASGYDDAVDAVENAPTADVAPRAEVAREIFEEIEKIMSKEKHKNETVRQSMTEPNDRSYFEGGANAIRQASYWIAELKKKYTEGCHD